MKKEGYEKNDRTMFSYRELTVKILFLFLVIKLLFFFSESLQICALREVDEEEMSLLCGGLKAIRISLLQHSLITCDAVCMYNVHIYVYL